MAASICKFCLVADATGRGITLLLLLLLRFLSHLLDLLLIHFKLLVQLCLGLLLIGLFLLGLQNVIYQFSDPTKGKPLCRLCFVFFFDLEHGLLLLLFFLLTIHDSQDDFPLLFREVAEVRHLGLRRRLRGRRGGSRAAPGPERSRHVWRSRTTLGKQGGNSAGSRGSGAGGWGSLRGWDKCIQINGLQSEATAPLPQERRQGEGRAEGGGLRSALGEMFLLPGGEGLPSERFAGARSWRPRRRVRGAAGEGGGVRWRGRLRVG